LHNYPPDNYAELMQLGNTDYYNNVTYYTTDKKPTYDVSIFYQLCNK